MGAVGNFRACLGERGRVDSSLFLSDGEIVWFISVHRRAGDTDVKNIEILEIFLAR